MDKVSRRLFLKRAGATAAGLTAAPAAIATAAAADAPAKAQQAHHPGSSAGQHAAPYQFFNAREAAIVEAAVERLIPKDELGPGALEAGVANYIDKQLAGAWGAGERLYRAGPWQEGKPSQGYQLPFTPAELFRNALRAIDEGTRGGGGEFAKRSPGAQDEYLKALEAGKVDLGDVPSKVFFESLLAMTVEGYFGDPVYGGNRDMAAWRMIGFPGAYANFYELVDQHGVAYNRVPMSLAEDAQGHIEVHPNIPAQVRGARK